MESEKKITDNPFIARLSPQCQEPAGRALMAFIEALGNLADTFEDGSIIQAAISEAHTLIMIRAQDTDAILITALALEAVMTKRIEEQDNVDEAAAAKPEN